MPYDFAGSLLILQHFCHFNPPTHFTPSHFPSALILHVLLHFHSHQSSFRHYLSVNTSHCLDPRHKWFLPQGVGSLALHRPLQTWNVRHALPPLPLLLRLSPPILSFSPLLSPQWMRDASWRKQREMGPITALGTESWLINSNSLTNCFFTKNHLSLSHGTYMHENLHLHSLPIQKSTHTHTHNYRYTCIQNVSPSLPVYTHTHTHSHTNAHRPNLLSCIYRKGNMLITLEWLIIAQWQ